MREVLAGHTKVVSLSSFVTRTIPRRYNFCTFCLFLLKLSLEICLSRTATRQGRAPCSDHVEHQGLRRRLRGRRARRGVRVLVHALRGKGEAESGERRADLLAPEPRRTTRRRPRPRRPEQPRGVRWRASAALPAAGIRAATLPSAPASATAAEFRRHGSSRAVAVPANLESPKSLGQSEAPIIHASLLFPAKTRAAFERERDEARTSRAMLK